MSNIDSAGVDFQEDDSDEEVGLHLETRIHVEGMYLHKRYTTTDFDDHYVTE